MPSVIRPAEQLYNTAEQQGGFFTAAQAKQAGYADNTHPYHVWVGDWIRERRGIYRLARYPWTERPDLMLWQLWSHNRRGEPQGTISHATALAIYELSDVNPKWIHMTVPPGFQRTAAIPKGLRLHRGRLSEDDIQTSWGVRITTPLRTLVDVIAEGTLAPNLLIQAVDDAIRSGRSSRRQLEAVKVSVRTRRRIQRVLAQVLDEDSTPVRDRQSAAHRARNATTESAAP